MKFFDVFKISTKPTKDVAIDLGTANTVVYVKGEGIQIDEPTYVALNIKTEEVEYIGEKAKEIIGRTAKHTEIVRPLKNGVISDYEITEKMLTEFLKRIRKDKVQSARVIICVPSGVTQVERRAVVEVVKDAVKDAKENLKLNDVKNVEFLYACILTFNLFSNVSKILSCNSITSSIFLPLTINP